MQPAYLTSGECGHLLSLWLYAWVSVYPLVYWPQLNEEQQALFPKSTASPNVPIIMIMGRIYIVLSSCTLRDFTVTVKEWRSSLLLKRISVCTNHESISWSCLSPKLIIIGIINIHKRNTIFGAGEDSERWMLCSDFCVKVQTLCRLPNVWL